MRSNRTHPQGRDGSKSKSSEPEKGCCGECGGCGCGCRCCSATAVCISGVLLCCVGLAALVVGLTVTFALPDPPSLRRDCRTAQNGSGFLCDDGVTCLSPSDLCNGAPDCPDGADESKLTCSDLPDSLPSSLIFRCGNPRIWTFIDRTCNSVNDCGDCSDETGVYASCPPCGEDWWSCTPVDFMYCDCVPRSLCRDGRQHCFDWSDEYICPKENSIMSYGTVLRDKYCSNVVLRH